MKRLLIFCFFLLFLGFIIPKTSFALTCGNGAGGTIRCAECDKCGYCYASQKAPGNWRTCASCLYNAIPTTAPATDNSSLEIKANSQGIFEQVTPAAGKYYTQLGCIDVGVSSFTDPTAAGGVLNFLLTRLIFPTVGTLAFLSLIYGAFLLITAQSEPEKIARGKSYVVGAIVGLIFTLSVILIINTIAGDVLRIPGFTQGNKAVVVANADTAVYDGQPINPELVVLVDNKEVQTLTLNPGANNINVNLPVKLTLSNATELQRVSFAMKRDECFTSSTTRSPPTCCDPGSSKASSAQCNNPKFSGDLNIKIRDISIDGKLCLGYSLQKNGSLLIISSTGTKVSCTSISS